MKTIIKSVIASAAVAAVFVIPAYADVADVNNIADVLHPNIHQNVTDGNNANPNDANDGGGNLHGIANTPGQNDTNPNDDGTAGFANQLQTVHGGIGAVNQNALP